MNLLEFTISTNLSSFWHSEFLHTVRKSQWFKWFGWFCFNMVNFCTVLDFDRLLLKTCCSTFRTREVLTACSGLTVKISVCNFQVFKHVFDFRQVRFCIDNFLVSILVFLKVEFWELPLINRGANPALLNALPNSKNVFLKLIQT